MNEQQLKLEKYLNNQDYQNAIKFSKNQYKGLSRNLKLELTRAFFVQSNYKKCMEIVKEIFGEVVEKIDDGSGSNQELDKLVYQSGMLKCKAHYFLGEIKKCRQIVDKLQKIVQQPNCRRRINKMKSSLDLRNSDHQNYTQQMRSQVSNLSSLAQKILKETSTALQLGMPMFVISQVWFNDFIAFCQSGAKKETYPGVITHFQIVDHRYNSFYDPNPQKQYTNYVLYPHAKVKVLTKKYWKELKMLFNGYDIKRFNVPVKAQPQQITTEILLKSLRVTQQNKNDYKILQISSKQNFASVIRKLETAWKKQDGRLYSLYKNQRVLVNPQQCLQQIDTASKTYEYSYLPPIDKEMNGKNNILQRCNYCKSTTDLRFCLCRSVKYCGMKCLKEDRERHRKKCEFETAFANKKAATPQDYNLVERQFKGRKGVVGLRNLGNTCYMNSGLQCLSNTKELTHYFMSNNFEREINKTNPLGTKGNLACSYAQLIRAMWTGEDRYLSPSDLKKNIGRFAKQFSGFGQQDSHQFINYLIDGISEDLNLANRNTSQYQEDGDQILPDEQASEISQQKYAKRIRSFVLSIMAGQFKSTVICLKCSKKLVCFDPFMFITLPILKSTKQYPAYFIASGIAHKAVKCSFHYDAHTTIGQIKKKMTQKFRVGMYDESWLEFFVVSLKTFEVTSRNISDETSYDESVNKLEEFEYLMAYEFSKPGRNQTQLQVDIYYDDKKICYPRFINVDPHSKYFQSRLEQELKKYISSQQRYQRISRQILAERIIIKDKNIIMRVSTRFKMLNCEENRDIFDLTQQKSTLSLDSCLSNYSKTEILDKDNQCYCSKCGKFEKTSKQIEIYKSNKILVLVLKRFNRGFKIKELVHFPIENFDMGPYLKSQSGGPVYYDLYGVVNHYGTMYGGHYTATCKNFLDNQWYYFDDSHVTQLNPSRIVSESAYILFYRLKD